MPQACGLTSQLHRADTSSPGERSQNSQQGSKAAAGVVQILCTLSMAGAGLIAGTGLACWHHTSWGTLSAGLQGSSEGDWGGGGPIRAGHALAVGGTRRPHMCSTAAC